MDAQATLTDLQYPYELAPRGEQQDEYPTASGGTEKVLDAYRFLEDPDSAETKAWVKGQNEVTKKVLDTCELRDKLNEKLTEVWNFSKTLVLSKQGDYYYFSHNTGLQNQFVYHRIKEQNSYKINPDAPLEGTEVFLDPNVLSEDGTSSVG